MKNYTVNEIFFSIQGEGARFGTPNIFVRFSGCNLACDVTSEEPNQQFLCDTEFVSGRKMDAQDIVAEAMTLLGPLPFTGYTRGVGVIFTGGEPGLQLDAGLIAHFRELGLETCIETNGTLDVSGLGLDYIACSPKVAEHALKLKRANEVRYVRHHGQGIPRPSIEASHRFISPAFLGNEMDPRAVAWCVKLVKENPEWRLSLQTHKLLQVR